MSDIPKPSEKTVSRPTRAARPETSAPETSSAFVTPSPEVTPPEIEQAHSVAAPAHDPAAANMAAPSVETTGRQRRGAMAHNRDAPIFKAPELLGGQSLGPNERRASDGTGERAAGMASGEEKRGDEFAGDSRPPAESENHRHTGARKLEARPEANYHEESRFHGQSSDEKDSIRHLMEPVVKEETHQYDGVNPPGSFGTDADPQADALEGDPQSATPKHSRRPL